MAEITVDVGVRLKAMQSSVADLQKVLDGLQPNSSGFKALQRIIADINRDIDRLRIQTSKPFGSQNQFNQTEKTVDKLEESLEKVKITIDRIKFSDLKLDSNQTAQLDNFKQQLKDIKQEFTDFKTDLKGQFLDNDFNKAFVEGINPNLLNKSFDEIVKNVENRVNSLGSTLAKAKAELENFQNAAKLGERINKASQTTNGIVSPEAMGQEMFDKFFQTNSKGVFSFKTGGGLKKGEIQQQFLDYLASEFQLTQSQIDQLKNQTASNIRKILAQDDFFNPQKGAAETANKKMDGAESAFTSASKNYENAAAVVARLTPLLSALSNEELSLEDKQKLVNQAIREFEQECVNGAKGSKTMDTALTGLDSQLNSFKTQLSQVNTQWLNLQKQQATFNSMKSAIVNFMGFNQVLNLTKKAVKEAMDHIKQLDTVMNGIAIVTNMTTADLWNQVDVYSEMAQRYGTSIQGAYEVSKIYYQAGYETNEVLTLMNETLKMSKISGLDYATTTDYMMNAIKGFKMEVADAASVVDVYSALAANTAVSQQELAEAMSKTASSMAGVGSTFEDTSAMIATMVSVTRESANNIGSAMKSIASRYGELTKDPTKLLDSEGEAMSFNKVDTALKSVGITLQTTDHQFRDFTDVIVELANKWDTLDSAQQRYIATQFAGNRQQNRFLALVSNKDLLQENMEVAAASEDTGTLQALKALDSLESKLNQVQVAYQQFYTTIGVEGIWKTFLEGTKNVIDTLNNLPKLFGKIPVGAIAVIYDIISLIKTAALNGLSEIATIWQNNIQKVAQTDVNTRPVGDKMVDGVLEGIKGRAEEIRTAFSNATDIKKGQGMIERSSEYQSVLENSDIAMVGTIAFNEEDAKFLSSDLDTIISKMLQFNDITEDTGIKLRAALSKGDYKGVAEEIEKISFSLKETGEKLTNIQTSSNGFKNLLKNSKHLSSDMAGFASALNMVGTLLNTTSREGQIASGSLMGLSGAFRLGSVAVQAFQGTLNGIPWMAIATGIISIINGISTFIETPTEKIERLTKEAENLNNEAKQVKAEYNTLQRSVDKLEELKEKRYESAEAAEAYQSAVDDLASKFPEMIAGFDEAGNIILDTTDAERILAEAREKSKQATYNAAKAEMDAAKEKLNEEKEGLTNLQLGLGENNSFNAGEKRYVNFFTDGEGNLIEDSLLGDFGNKQSHGLPNSSLEEGISFETFKNELYDLASKYSEDQASIWYFLWDYIDEEKETLTNVDALKNVLQNKIQSNDEGAQKYQELLNLLTDNTALETQSTEIENLLKQIKEPDFDLVANAEQLTSLSLKLEEILKDTNLDENAKAYYENLQTQLKPIIDKVKNIFTLNEAYKGNERIVISAWQQANDNNGKAWEYLEESSGLAAIITKQIQSDIGDTDYTTAEVEQASKWKEYQAAAEQFYSGLSEADQKIFNQMIEDTANYSGTDIAKYFNIAEGTDLYNAIINYYSDGVKSIQDRLKNNLTAYHDVDFSSLKETDTDFISNYAKLISDENNEFTKNEESFLNSILSQFDSLNKQGFAKRAEVIGLAGINLFEEIQTLPEDIQKSLINSISQNGLTTKEGIQKTLDSFKNDKTITNTQVDEYLEQIISQIINNVPLAVQTATSELLENWDDTSKELTKALSGGLEFKEAEALITKAESLGVSLDLNTDFVQNGDKLILTSEKFNEYWGKLNKQSKKNAEEWQSDIDAAQAVLDASTSSNWQNRVALSEEMKASIEAIAPNFDWENYTEYGRLNLNGIIALQKAIQESSEGLERYNTYAEMAAQQLKQTQEWILGDYSSLSLSPEALKELSSGKTVLKREDYNLRAARDNINSAYNSLISDVLSKGFDKINLEDYSGLIDAGEGIDLANTSYEDFVREYAIWAGKSIEETNSLIIQAIEKDTQTTTGAAAEAVGKIQWLNDKNGLASLGDIQNLADALGISVDAILGEYNAQLDSYEVDVSQIDLSNVDNFRESVYDSINEFLKKVTDGISKGISGKLSGADVTTLNGQLKQLGIEGLGKTDFTETAEGLKISQRAAIDLYTELKKIDALQGQLIFEDLAKSLEASDTNYTNISTTLARIAELEKAIKEMKPDDARLQMYKNELAVAQEIARTRSSTDNKDFNFMDRALPTGMQNPIDYWNATGEAYKVMNASAKSGYMEIQDFYNIVQEMSNMAQVSGQTLHFMGQEIDGSAEAAASLIQRGFSALTNVKGDGVKIALGNIGADFKTGAVDMKGDFDSGIKEMAKSQIQMLDAAINMLEAIVAMEDIDVDQDGLFSLDELFNGGNAAGGWTKSAEDWFNKLDGLTGGIEVGGVDLKTALLNMAQSGEDGAERVKQFMNDLKNIDWTLGDVNVAEKVRQLVQGLFVGQEITQGKSIFDVLKIPKNAEKNSEEFNKWVTDIGLDVDNAVRLIDKIQNTPNGDIAAKGGNWYSAIEKMLGLDGEKMKEVKQAFEDFTGVTVSAEELKLWENINIETDANGHIIKSVYTASDGSTKELEEPKSKWNTQIQDKENEILIKEISGSSSAGANAANTEIKDLTIEGVTYKIVHKTDGEDAGWYGTFNNQRLGPFDTEEELQAEIAKLAQNARGGGKYVAPVNPDKNNPEIDVNNDYEIKYNWHYRVGQNQNDPNLKNDAEIIKGMGRDALQKEINEAKRNTKDGEPITIKSLPGIEFDPNTVTPEIIQGAADEILGNTELYAGLPEKIAEGITTAFTQDTSISEAIGQGIKTALTTGTDENGQPQDIPLPTLNLKPESITIQAGEITPTIAGVNENSNLPIPSVTIEAQNVLLTSTVAPNSDGLNIPTSIPKEDLSIIYSALNLIGYKKNVNESGVYLPAILEKHPVVAAYLAMLLLMSNSDTNYNAAFVNNPSENLDKKFKAAAILAKLVLSSDENTEFIEGSISVGEGKQLKIKQVLEAIATGKIKINSPENGSSIEEGNIIIGEGENQLTLSQIEWTTAIDAIKAELGSNYQVVKTGVTLTEDDLTLDPKELIQPISGIRYTNNFQKSREKVGLNNDWGSIDNNNKLGKDLVTSKNNDYLNYLEETAKYVGKGGILTSVDWTYLNPLKEMSDVTIPESVLTTLQSIDGLDLTNVKLENSQDLFNLLVQLQQFNESNSSSFSSITDSLNALEVGELPEISTALQDVVTQAQLLEAINWQTIIDGINGVTKANLVTKPNSNNPEENGDTPSNSTQTVVVEVDANTEKANEKVTSLNSSIEDEVKKKPVDIDDSAAQTTLSNLESAIQATVNKYADIYINYTQQYKDALADITKDVDKTVNIKTKGTVNTGPGPKAGNVALATGTGNAYSAGNTLMGELGPEMVVSHGRYFVVGQNGPEMVNLAEDAIVFNHLQTEQLLRHGKASGHAKPVTNERKATSLATGNVGPAMASASAALDVLKQLRSMWQSLLNASLKDLGGLAGGSGGGGGGGGGGNDEATKGVLGNIERWYNYLQLIESTQVKINKLTKEYTLLEKQGASSNTRLDNLKNEYDLLKENKENREKLTEEQTKYRKKLLKQVQTGKGKYGLLSAFYDGNAEDGTFTLKSDKAFQEFVKKRGKGKTLKKGVKVTKRAFYNEEEAEKYNKKYEDEIKKGTKKAKKAGDVKKKKSKKTRFKATSGLELFEELQKTDQYGNLIYSAKDQLKILEDLGFGEYLKKDASGNKLKTAEEKVEYFFSQIESGKGEIDALTDSINDQEQAALDDAIAMQEINEKIREIYKVVPGVNEGLDKWYNYTRKIADEQNRLNKLTKENAILQKDQIGNGKEIYENYKQQLNSLENNFALNENYINARRDEANRLADDAGSLMNFFERTEAGSYIFDEEPLIGIGNISYQTAARVKTNELGYEVDENEQYVDDKGILRDKAGNEVKNGSYGQTQVLEWKTAKFNTSGNILDVINNLTKQDATGKVALSASEQYQIIKQLGLEEFIKYEENGEQIYSNFGEMSQEEKQKAVEVGINRIREKITELNDNNDEIVKLNNDNLDINSQILDIQNTLRDNSIDVQNMVKDAIVQEHQDAIDQKKELTDAIKNAADKTISGLKDSLEKEKNVYDSDKDEKDLVLLQMQLSTARVSGNASAKVLELQKQIAEKQKEIYFNERQASIDDLEDAANKQVEALEEQTNIMQTVLDYQVKYGQIWEEVNDKLSENPAAIVDYILKHSPDYVAANTTEQEKNQVDKEDAVELYKQQVADEKNSNDDKEPIKIEPEKVESKKVEPEKEEQPIEDFKLKKETTIKNALNNLQLKKEFNSPEVQKFLSSRVILGIGSQVYDNLKFTNEEDKEKAVERAMYREVSNRFYALSPAGVWESFKTEYSGLVSRLKEGDLTNLQHFSEEFYNSSKEETLEGKAKETMSATVKFALDFIKRLDYLEHKNHTSRVPSSRRYASGGDIDFTGPAWVDGSKSQPEHIFNFKQMEQLKNMFLDNLATTQLGIVGLSSIMNNLPNTNSYNNINNEDNGININQLDFHMEVQEISDDYSARKAGREAMEEMVRIARKAGNRSISRR